MPDSGDTPSSSSSLFPSVNMVLLVPLTIPRFNTSLLLLRDIPCYCYSPLLGAKRSGKTIIPVDFLWKKERLATKLILPRRV